MNWCDVIIPTHGHNPALGHTLLALAEQSLPSSWRPRLVLSLDGPATLPPLHFPSPWESPLIVRGERAGAAAARNRALAAVPATRPGLHIALFLGDDIILRPRALAAHLAFHRQHPQVTFGALGFIAWDPRLRPSPLMEWMVHGGPQNNFDDLLSGRAVNPSHFFYGSFVSVKRSLLASQQFPAYTHYGWEDLDFGRQLADQGLQLYPLLTARAHHHHAYAPAAIIQRSRLVGRSLVAYQQRYPRHDIGLPKPRTWWRAAIYRYTGLGALCRLALRRLAPRYSLPRLFLVVTAAEHWRGYFSTKPWKSKK